LVDVNVHGERVLTGIRSRIPVGVWLILNGIMAISVAAAGYHAGLAGTQRFHSGRRVFARFFSGDRSDRCWRHSRAAAAANESPGID
jgi:hypothetical protein